MLILFDLLPMRAGHTVTNAAFNWMRLPAPAVIVEIWPATATGGEMAELDNGLFVPLAELTLVDTGERWAPIPGYSWYRISSHGKIVSLLYKAQARHRLLKHLNEAKYPEVRLSNEDGFIRIGVNRLVAQTFLPPPERQQNVVIPLDGNRFNLRADNLRWAGHHDATDPAAWQHLHACHTRQHTYKLSEADKEYIKVLAEQGLTKQTIAQLFGVSRSTISILLSKWEQRKE